MGLLSEEDRAVPQYRAPRQVTLREDIQRLGGLLSSILPDAWQHGSLAGAARNTNRALQGGHWKLEYGPNGEVYQTDTWVPYEGSGMDRLLGVNPLLEFAGASGVAAPLAKTPKGALAVFGGVKAKNAPLNDLAKAEAMEAAGDHADDIWRATGWGRGADGKWRFEIDDSGSALSDRALGAALNSGKMRGKDLEDALDRVINHPDLFNNYELDIKARLGNYPGVDGGYDQAGREIAVKAPDPVEARSTLLHETQHAVQGHEGFARGGSPDEFAPHNPNSPASVEIARLKEYWLEKHGPRYDDLGDKMGAGTATPGEIKEFDALDDEWFSLVKRERENSLSAFDRYKRIAGEAEARNVERRRDWTPEMRRETPPWYTEDVPRDKQIVRGTSGGVSMSTRDGEPIKGLLSEGSAKGGEANSVFAQYATPGEISKKRMKNVRQGLRGVGADPDAYTPDEMRGLLNDIYSKQQRRSALKGDRYDGLLHNRATRETRLRQRKLDARAAAKTQVPMAQHWAKGRKEDVASSYRLGGFDHLADADARDATTEAIARAARKAGFKVRHTSKGKNGRVTSRYLVAPNGLEVRLSNHFLPDTPRRANSPEPRWVGEIVVDDWQTQSLDDYMRELLEMVED